MSKVDHPDHYGGEDNPYEAIKIIEALGFGEGFCAGNAIKYMVRAGVKNPATKTEDLEKASWYLERWIAGDYKQAADPCKYNSANLVERAQVFALKRHAGQMYGDLPYGYHLLKVVQVLERFDAVGDYLIAAAWLHDVIEDTDTTYKEVLERFGESVAELVSRVSDDNSIAGRTAKKADVYKRIGASPWNLYGQNALVIKLADRIANVEACISGSKKLSGDQQAKCMNKLEMYREEQSLLIQTFLGRLPVNSYADQMFTTLKRLFHESATL